MNTAEKIYQSVQTLPENEAEEVLIFIDFLKFKHHTAVGKTAKHNNIKQLLNKFPVGNRSSADIDQELTSLRDEWD